MKEGAKNSNANNTWAFCAIFARKNFVKVLCHSPELFSVPAGQKLPVMASIWMQFEWSCRVVCSFSLFSFFSFWFLMLKFFGRVKKICRIRKKFANFFQKFQSGNAKCEFFSKNFNQSSLNENFWILSIRVHEMWIFEFFQFKKISQQNSKFKH